MIRLEEYQVSEKTGFLPEKDTDREAGPSMNPEWEELAGSLPKFLPGGGIRKRIAALPPFLLPAHEAPAAAWERDMRTLSYLGHAYLWGDRPVPASIPAVLARPWHAVALKIGRHPILSYPSYCLFNFRRFDPDGPAHIGNIAIVQNFLAGLDEDWFILIHVDIEARAATALAAIPAVMAAAEKADVEALVEGLGRVRAGLADMNAILLRMPEGCDPYIYYTRVRPYIFGTKNNPAVPNGMIYEGCYDGKAQFFRGETGAQSSIIPTIDGLLGVRHQDDPLKEYLLEMRHYMPPAHRAFLERVEKESQVRTRVEQNRSHRPLVEIYNACFDELYAFRAKHLEYAAAYIHKQSVQTNNSTAVGTGGTPFMAYLAKHRDETRIEVQNAIR
jgi:indoleamine 2,3-dioxygenase